MKFRIIELEDTEVFGISEKLDGDIYKCREELREIMWTDKAENIPERLCEGKFNQQDNTAFDGMWFGIWKDDRYMIARKREDVKSSNLQKEIITGGTYVAFTSERGGYAGTEIPRLFEDVFDLWLPTSGYKLRDDTIIEIYHL